MTSIRATEKPGHTNERTVVQLVNDLSGQTRRLVRDEITLAQLELKDKAKKGAGAAALLGAATLCALAALGALTAFAIISLDLVTPTWLAAGIVLLAWVVLAIALALAGRARLRHATPPLPQMASRSVAQDISAVKEGMGR